MRSVVFVFALLLAQPLGAVVNGYVPAPTDESQDATGAFGLAWQLGLDPQHPGAQDHEWFCDAILVAPSTAWIQRECLHTYGASASYAVRFRRKVAGGPVGTIAAGVASFYHTLVEHFYVPGCASYEIPPSGGQAVCLDAGGEPTSPLGHGALAYLVEPVAHVAALPLLFQHGGAGTPVTINGWGRQGPAPGEGPKTELRACSTTITATGIPAGVLLWFPDAWDPGGPGCGPNNNDSGGAIIVWSQRTNARRLIGAINGYAWGQDVAQYAADPAFQAVAAGW